MKILHITASYKPAYVYGGPIYSVAALCEALGKDSSAPLRTTSVEVITTLANGKEELAYPSGEKIELEGVGVCYFKRLTKDHSHFSPALLWWLWKHAKQYDMIHIHSWWNLVSMGSVLICLLRGIKPLVSPRGMLGDYTFTKGKKLFHQFIGKRLLRRCNFHATTMMEAEEITLSIWSQKELDRSSNPKVKIIDLMNDRVKSEEWKVERKEIKEQRAKSKEKGLQSIFVIHNMITLPDQFPVKTRVFDGTLKLIFLSRIHHKKGIELLFDTLAKFSFPFSLSIVGEGESVYIESLKGKVEYLGLAKHIEWLGPIYGEEKYKLLSEHDLFVLPSFNENFANVVIESLAVNTPVLISDQVGLCHYVQNNGLGLVHTNNILSLKNALTDFVDKPILVKDITKYFSPLHLRKQYLEMYYAQ